MYQLTSTTAILRTSDGAIIPADAGNSDYQAYLAWISVGNISHPGASPPNPLIIAAQTALFKSDITVIRCCSAGVAVPDTIQTYRNALRAIVTGIDTTSNVLPAAPELPEGI